MDGVVMDVGQRVRDLHRQQCARAHDARGQEPGGVEDRWWFLVRLADGSTVDAVYALATGDAACSLLLPTGSVRTVRNVDVVDVEVVCASTEAGYAALAEGRDTKETRKVARRRIPAWD